MKHALLWNILLIFAFLACSCGMGAPSGTPDLEPEIVLPDAERSVEEAYIDAIIDGMSLREQVSQLFIIPLASLTEEAKPGGYILFKEDISTAESVRALTDALRGNSSIAPFIGIDEEGGTVSRLASAGLPGYVNQLPADQIGYNGDAKLAEEAGRSIGKTLGELGFNLDFAPVADVLTTPGSKSIGSRSYGSDPEQVADMAAAFRRGLRGQGILSTPKHFPGHGGAVGDSHYEPAVLNADMSRLEAVEYPPFIRLIGEDCSMVMVGHIMAPKVDESGLPASLSSYFVTDELRGRLGFEGVIVTDAMNMGAITESWKPEEAAVMAIQAGVDLVLMPEDFDAAVNGVCTALSCGELDMEQLRQSLARILKLKLDAGILARE